MEDDELRLAIENIRNDQVRYEVPPDQEVVFDRKFNQPEEQELRGIIASDKHANSGLVKALEDPRRFAIAHVLLMRINGWRLGGSTSARRETDGEFEELHFKILPDGKLEFPESSIPKVAAHWKRMCKLFGLLNVEFDDAKIADAAYSHPDVFIAKSKSTAMMSIKEIWGELDKHLEKLAPSVYKTLLPGATEAELVQMEKRIQQRIQGDLRQSLMCHNGQRNNEIGLVNGFSLCSCTQIAEGWELYKELAPHSPASDLPPGVSGESQWSEFWIFAMQFESEFVCVDMMGKGDNSGALFMFEDFTYSETIIAESWGRFLMTFLEKLENLEHSILIDGLEIEFGPAF